MSDEKWIIDSDHTMEGYFKDQMYEPGREEIEAFIKDMEGMLKTAQESLLTAKEQLKNYVEAYEEKKNDGTLEDFQVRLRKMHEAVEHLREYIYETFFSEWTFDINE